MLSVTCKPYTLSVVMLSVVILSVVMMSVMAPLTIMTFNRSNCTQHNSPQPMFIEI
jgi:hypothetical protein